MFLGTQIQEQDRTLFMPLSLTKFGDEVGLLACEPSE